MLFSAQYVAAQNSISGTVKDNNGLPLPSASIVVKNTKNGVTADMDGKFSIKIPENGAILVCSYIGMQTQEIAVIKQKNIDIIMQESKNLLDEVVVVGYGQKVKKSDLTGSVASIKKEAFEQAQRISVLEGMQGRLSGVQITSESGEPGSGMNIVVRGGNSINSDNQPLYVIDGIQIEAKNSEVASGQFASSSTLSPLSSLNPNDIESIEILKDASSTAIYGSRGANGVVVITTKQGKSGVSNVSFSHTLAISNASKKLDVLNGKEYAEMRFLTAPQTALYGIDTNGDSILDQPRVYPESETVNWQDEALRQGIAQNYNFAMSGGSDKSTYSSSLSYFKNDAIIKGTGYDRYNASLTVNQKVKSFLTTGGTVNFSQTINSGAALTGGNGDFNGLLQSILLFNPILIAPENQDAEFQVLTNPYNMLTDAYKNVKFNRMLVSGFAEIKFNDNLNFRATIGGNTTGSKSKEFYGKETSWGRVENGKGLIKDIKSDLLFSRNILNYKLNVNNNHKFTFMGAFEFEKSNQESFSVSTSGYVDETTGINDISKALVSDTPESFRESSTRASVLSRINYTLKNRYLFTTSFRADGTSKFRNDKWGYFPSAAFAWKMNNEKFMKKLRDISEAKLRLSAGITGNDRIPIGVAYNQATSTDYASGGALIKGISSTYIANNELTWETTTQFDAGLDLGFLKNRISATFDVYYKKTNDLLFNAEVRTSSGQASQWINIGEIENKGVEFSLNSTNIQVGKFRWETNLNFTMNQNKILSLGNVNQTPITVGGSHLRDVAVLKVGQAIGTGYGYVFDGIYQFEDFSSIVDANNNPVALNDIDQSNLGLYRFTLANGVTSIAGRTVRVGDFKYKDLNGDGIVDLNNDRTIISQSNPKHFGGITNLFAYNNFELSFLLRWSYGNQVLNGSRVNMESGDQNQFNLTKDYWYNRWTPENPSNQYGSILNNGSKDVSSYYVEDASYLRLQNINISYSLPTKFLQKYNISQIKFFAVADNLKVWTKYSGLDPEVNFNNPSITGLDRLVYPRSTTFTFGFNVNF